MEFTINVDESMLVQTATRAIEAAFYQGGRFEGSGAGVVEIRRQANIWAETQDYTEVIKSVAPGIFTETVKSVVVEAIKAEVKKQIKLMKETGELGGLFKEVQ